MLAVHYEGHHPETQCGKSGVWLSKHNGAAVDLGHGKKKEDLEQF